MTSYVLFVGDHEDIPGWEIVGHNYHGKNHKWHTDFEYTLVDGEDTYPDLVLGRFPGDTEAQITSMVARTLSYEKKHQSILIATITFCLPDSIKITMATESPIECSWKIYTE